MAEKINLANHPRGFWSCYLVALACSTRRYTRHVCIKYTCMPFVVVVVVFVVVVVVVALCLLKADREV